MDLKELERKCQPIFDEFDITKSAFKYIGGKSPTLEIMIMKSDGSMDMLTCEQVSRKISALLDELDFSNQAYNLDVCSFGAERVLDSLDEIKREIGNYIHIELKNPKEGLDIFEGTLKDVDKEQITVEYLIKGRSKTAIVDYDNVRNIRLAVKV